MQYQVDICIIVDHRTCERSKLKDGLLKSFQCIMSNDIQGMPKSALTYIGTQAQSSTFKSRQSLDVRPM